MNKLIDYFKNLKIITKLTISSLVFLLPLGIMLFSIISMSLVSIRKDQKELRGIDIIRPAISLMQTIPQFVRISVDGSPGDLEFTKHRIDQLLAEMKNQYELYFPNDPLIVSPQTLIENWNHLSNTSIRDTILWAYRQIIQDLHKIIVYVGDISGLITASDIECAYLVAATIHELPQAQERMVLIGNLLRTAEDGAFTQRRRAELQRNLDLLIHSDNARIQKRHSSAGSLRINSSGTFEHFELLLRACYDRLSYFAGAVTDVINEPVINIYHLPVLYETASHANNAAYRLQAASLDRLQELITARIFSYRLRLVFSLLAGIFATLFAFSIIFATMFSIRNSTVGMGKVFNHLNNNDLSVKIEKSSDDELGDFMSSLSSFLEKLNKAFTSVNKNSDMVSMSMLELSSSAKQMTATANEQSASVAEIVSTMENNKNLSAQAAEKTTEVAELALQTQQLSRRGADLRDVNENMMRDILNQNTKTIEIIRNLAEMLSRIDESIKLIDTIADHTKLIAFNAALEASSSGEAGARFSVVASEIRRFADNVVESAAEIKEKINELNEAAHMLLSEANNGSVAIDSGYTRMVEQKEVFEHIVEVSQNVAIRSQQISSLSKQQEYASSQVFSALKEISSGVNQFVSATTLTSATVEKLNNMSKDLKETLAKYHITNGEKQ
jgi:methyl-accepting chemotaxis protein